MKQLTIATALLLFIAGQVNAFNEESKDTTIVFRDKIIQIRDSIDQVNVKVSVLSVNGQEAYQTVFEGLYSDSRSYERWTVAENLGIQIPFVTNRYTKPKRNKEMKPHWAGFGWGFTTMTDGSAINNVNGMDLILGRSHEFNYNLIEHITPVFLNIIGLTSGLGFSWQRYYMDNSLYLKETYGIVSIYDNSPLKYKYSKLSNWYLTVPLLLELQIFKSSKYKPYLAAGVVGGVRLATVFKSKYYNSTGSTVKTKERGLNVLPVTYDYMVMGGYGNASIYAKFSPIGIFESGKGPAVQHASIGFMLDL